MTADTPRVRTRPDRTATFASPEAKLKTRLNPTPAAPPFNPDDPATWWRPRTYEPPEPACVVSEYEPVWNPRG